MHRIDAASPLAGWLDAGGLSEDADSEIVVVVSCAGAGLVHGQPCCGCGEAAVEGRKDFPLLAVLQSLS